MRYEIKGGNLPVVECILENGEQIITESGGMSWMSPNMQMETKGGGMKKMFGRMFSGEHMFQNIYTAKGGRGLFAMASSFPGDLKAFDVSGGRDIILQKSAFLGSEATVNREVVFQKNLGTGLFGGEGFILQRCYGKGIVFGEFDGAILEYELQPGQQIVVDTGHVAAMDASVHMEIQSVKGMKNKFLGGEGLFNTVLTGPGKVYLQTMPMSKLAEELSTYLPSATNSSPNESLFSISL